MQEEPHDSGALRSEGCRESHTAQVQYGVEGAGEATWLRCNREWRMQGSHKAQVH